MTSMDFPQGFLWGSATAAHQVEGQNVHSDWWAWEQAGCVKTASGSACDHYSRFADDFDLAASLGHNAHRFSIEWSRLEPVRGRWDDHALAHYVEVVRALRQRGLEPIVTLHHFTSPQWFTELGGWARPEAVDEFARYVARVADALGRSVRYWITINEPMVYVRLHHVQGLGPPGGRDLPRAIEVTRQLVRAHAAAYRILHERAGPDGLPIQVSIAHNAPAFWPCRRWWPMDRLVTARTDQIFNLAFVEAITDGCWTVPGVGRWRIPEARATCDFLGINYYGRQFIRWLPVPGQWPGVTCDLGHHPRQVRERTSFGWDVHPQSLGDGLERYAHWFKLPILITENGTWMEDDTRRWSYILRHIQAMAQAMQAGVAVLGYCYWSLLDNFEWADGFAPRFGLIEIDYATQQRRVRESARRYAEICRSNRVALS